LYLFAINIKNGLTVAHPYNPKFIGKDVMAVKDKNGIYFFLEFWKTAKNGGGWVDYTFPRPNEKVAVPKSAYIMPVQGTDIFIGCAYSK
jgi:signal transduction histidine kinase